MSSLNVKKKPAPTIAIDGVSGCGKSSTAQAIAKELGYHYIDTGAMYRAITYYLTTHLIDLNNEELVLRTLDHISLEIKKDTSQFQLLLNGEHLGNKIRQPAINDKVSQVAAIKSVRTFLVKIQREWGKNGGVVLDGRDIGTYVFPHAEVKIFMTASLEIRTERRLLELEEKGIATTYKQVYENFVHRDRIDTERKENPLRKAESAITIDSSHLTFDAQIKKLIEIIKSVIVKPQTP